MIEGVEVVHLKRYADDRGFLSEILRSDDPHFKGFGQVYISCVRRGFIKAWHSHQHQTDAFYVVKGTAKIGLYDDREGSSTYDTYQTVVLGEDGYDALLMIPEKVWHGLISLSETTYMINIPSKPYDRENCDELRRTPDTLKDIWTIKDR